MITKEQRKKINEKIVEKILSTSEDENEMKKIAIEVIKENAVNKLSKNKFLNLIQFLGMPFNIFIFSTILIGSFTYFFMDWQKGRENYKENLIKMNEIVVEFESRIERLKLSTDTLAIYNYYYNDDYYSHSNRKRRSILKPIQIFYGIGLEGYTVEKFKKISLYSLANQFKRLDIKNRYKSDSLIIIFKSFKKLIDKKYNPRGSEFKVTLNDTLLPKYYSWNVSYQNEIK